MDAGEGKLLAGLLPDSLVNAVIRRHKLANLGGGHLIG